LSFYAIAASAPCSDPHVSHVHSGFVRGASLNLCTGRTVCRFCRSKNRPQKNPN